MNDPASIASPPLPDDYSRPFWLVGPVGNNALSYARRGPSPRLWVPSLVCGTFADVALGEHVAFEDVDEHGRLQSCTGLRHLVRTTWAGIPTVVVDNHNHAFYFWSEAAASGRLQPGATLVHLDQHRDMRAPAQPFQAAWTLKDIFRYANAHLNVGNYIMPARQAGLIGTTLMVTGSDGLGTLALAGRPNLILNIDLDFFAPEMSYIAFDSARRFIDTYASCAVLITVATSPFFIDQQRALEFLRKLTTDA